MKPFLLSRNFLVLDNGVLWFILVGPIPMMVGSELFRQEPRAIAMAVGGAVNWTFTFIIALGFESVQVCGDFYRYQSKSK